MALSTGSRRLLTDLVGWTAALAVAAVAIWNSRDLLDLFYAQTAINPAKTARSGSAVSGQSSSSTTRTAGSSTELRVGANGHFFSDADVNGRRINVLIDTGASMVALTYADARTIGLSPRASDFTHQVSTANGIAKVAPVTLDRVQIGDVMLRNVTAAVVEEGKLQTTLLGNSFLSKLSRYEMRSGRLIMEE
jgi:aspartyl protease family protein